MTHSEAADTILYPSLDEIHSTSPRSQYFQSLFNGEVHDPSQPKALEDASLLMQAEMKASDQEIRIDILEFELDQHKDAMAEQVRHIAERDCTIKTQCFHIVSLHQKVRELQDEVAIQHQSMQDLRRQLSMFTEEDWQVNSGISKKRKLCI